MLAACSLGSEPQQIGLDMHSFLYGESRPQPVACQTGAPSPKFSFPHVRDDTTCDRPVPLLGVCNN